MGESTEKQFITIIMLNIKLKLFNFTFKWEN